MASSIFVCPIVNSGRASTSAVYGLMGYHVEQSSSKSPPSTPSPKPDNSATLGMKLRIREDLMLPQVVDLDPLGPAKRSGMILVGSVGGLRCRKASFHMTHVFP